MTPFYAFPSQHYNSCLLHVSSCSSFHWNPLASRPRDSMHLRLFTESRRRHCPQMRNIPPFSPQAYFYFFHECDPWVRELERVSSERHNMCAYYFKMSLRRCMVQFICKIIIIIIVLCRKSDSFLCCGIYWEGSTKKRDTGRLERLVRRAGSVIGMELESLTSVAEKRTLNRLVSIV